MKTMGFASLRIVDNRYPQQWRRAGGTWAGEDPRRQNALPLLEQALADVDFNRRHHRPQSRVFTTTARRPSRWEQLSERQAGQPRWYSVAIPA